ncbi:unnamed protein product [Strongylus vulgaris]|uniref:Uncharacterized protein n=1 Tax=Strongylus vulgaris TaxID=40348 RepID=A0A3P7JS28_STRVU|nr:unnamed protein product [Strongylus vulgaris]
MARSRSQPTVGPSAALKSKNLSEKPLELAYNKRMSRRSQPVAMVDPVPARALEEPDEATIRLARRISSEVMKDLRKKYGNVDIGFLGV